MTTEIKLEIVNAANDYIAKNNLSINELCRQSGINVGYTSSMLKGTFTFIANNKEGNIPDKWFVQLADHVGFAYTKTYWETIPTRQFKEVIFALNECRDKQKSIMLIGDTGSGKTKATDVFVNKNPLHTYRITISSLHRLQDIVYELMDKVGVDISSLKNKHAHTSPHLRLVCIVDKLIEIKRAGGNPILIFDECENMEGPTLKMIKALYDAIYEHCGIALIGTSQLTNKLLRMRAKNRDAIPQLFRRFKAGQRQISQLNKKFDFLAFFERFEITPSLQHLLLRLADNYGELHDYLEPALRESYLAGQPLTEDLFRTIHNLPK